MAKPGSIKRASVMPAFSFDTDLGFLFPYINAVATGAELHESPSLIRFELDEGVMSPFNSRWTQSLATGGEAFVKRVKSELGSKASGRTTHGALDDFELREDVLSYIACFTPEKHEIGLFNTYKWQVSLSISGG